MTKDQIKAMLLRYEAGACTDEEKALLETWFLKQHTDHLPSPAQIEDDLDRVWAAISTHQLRPPIVRLPRAISRIAAAASIILAFSIFGYFLLNRQKTKQQTAQNQAHDIAPGGNEAILTLGNGQQIKLTDKKNGRIARQAGKMIVVGNNGVVSYSSGREADPQAAAPIFNTLTTPLGNQRAMTLADGTEVTLDAGSSITFPVVFDKKERNVSITGQVYFKVKHNASQPFNVKVNGITVRDIGTEFNINAYDNEPDIKTTLIEGSVEVNKGSRKAIIKPGEQAVALADKEGINVTAVDTEPVVAWKNGDFRFKDEDFKTAMRQISRWYNVEIVYDEAMPDNFAPGGWVSRSKNISAVLRIMELTGKVHFKVDGRRVTVTK